MILITEIIYHITSSTLQFTTCSVIKTYCRHSESCNLEYHTIMLVHLHNLNRNDSDNIAVFYGAAVNSFIQYRIRKVTPIY